MKTVCIIGGGFAYARMFRNRGWVITEYPHEADLLQFTGGSDVHPLYYDEKSHPTTHSDLQRDNHEHDIFTDYVGSRLMAGICRGGQFLNVMNGGKMFQDVDGHAIGGTHSALIEKSGKVIQVTSTHHQMMREGEHGEVLMYAAQSKVREHMLSGKVHRLDGEHDDVEVVLYSETNCLCFQPHPELDRAPKECTDYYFELLDQLME